MIKDRIFLGVVAGLAGNIAKTAIDEVSLRWKISKRSFRSTAAGVWLPSIREAESTTGQILGSFLDFGTAILGGIGTVELLTATGRDKVLVKGIVSGATVGSLITAAMSGLKENKVQPKDAASNLSYMVSHAVYGLVATALAAKLGDDSLFTERPISSMFVRMVSNNVK